MHAEPTPATPQLKVAMPKLSPSLLRAPTARKTPAITPCLSCLQEVGPSPPATDLILGSSKATRRREERAPLGKWRKRDSPRCLPCQHGHAPNRNAGSPPVCVCVCVCARARSCVRRIRLTISPHSPLTLARASPAHQTRSRHLPRPTNP